MMESAPKPNRPQKRPATAALNVCIYKVTDRAGDVWSNFEESPSASLWQIQLDHNAQQSVLFQMGNAFADFLREESGNKQGYPNSMDELLNQGGVKYVLSDRHDPEGAGFIQWRAGFYVAGVAGAVKNFLMLLDDFFVWKMKAVQKEGIEVRLVPRFLRLSCACALRCGISGAHLPAWRRDRRRCSGRVRVPALHAPRCR
ncbi:MAG: hypothetical protein CMN05_14095 [Roseibacillus sp.]|nr:hypothetical protein [Roseibacillus sp.]